MTGFERLSTSKDETRYALTLEPRLALLDRSHQNAIYRDMSVPQIVEKISGERHGMRGRISCSYCQKSTRVVNR